MPWPEWTTRKSSLDAEELNLIKRLLILRKQRRVGPILAEFGNYWICTSELDPHGSKEYYSYERLKEMIERVESEPWIDTDKRKPVESAKEITNTPESGTNARNEYAKRAVNGRD